MDKRYQVFVSSTYVDLTDERNEIMQALLELECMPAGMELFPAANDTQWEWIKKVIDESDYYIVVIGGRYGSISEKTGFSYTEMEYRYAIDTNKPIIGFLHHAPDTLPAKKTEQTDANIKKLNNFRKLVQSKLCKFYTSPEDLGSKVSRSIIQLKKQYPAIGWVRANTLENFTSSNEHIELMKENEELKKKIDILESESPIITKTLASGKDKIDIEYTYELGVLKKNKKGYGNYVDKTNDGSDVVSVTWDDLFSILSLDLIKDGDYRRDTPPTTENLVNQWYIEHLPKTIQEREKDKLKNKHSDLHFYGLKIKPTSMHKILIHLRALKLIKLGKENFIDEECWRLTKYGEEYLVDIMGTKK
jgi:hypothetical protein